MKLYGVYSELDFGKYKGQQLLNVAKKDLAYINKCLIKLEFFMIDDGTVQVLKYLIPDFYLLPEAEEARSIKLLKYYGGDYCNV